MPTTPVGRTMQIIEFASLEEIPRLDCAVYQELGLYLSSKYNQYEAYSILWAHYLLGCLLKHKNSGMTAFQLRSGLGLGVAGLPVST